MCTSIVLYRKFNKWPIIIGSNRDENLNRKSKFPGRHWKKYPNIIAGKDQKKQGSWIGINDYGIVAIIHNRFNINENNKEKISRGKIVLEVLQYKSIDNTIKFISSIDKNKFKSFN